MKVKKTVILIFSVIVALSTSGKDKFHLIDKGQGTNIHYVGHSQVVNTAIEMLTNDSKLISSPFKFSSTLSEDGVVVGVIGENIAFDKLLIKYKIDVKGIKNQWEACHIEVSGKQENILFVVGSDPRGAAYGVLELSRKIGISPWMWWADVVPSRKETVTLPFGFKETQKPSVQYRGIFLNDEDWGIVPWSSQTFEPSTVPYHMGPKTYGKVFELLLRLRANTLWPAMHERTTPFYTVKGNRETAEKYGIVMGTSHCEPLMRNNAGEWYKENLGRYNFKSNRENIINYWAERLKEVAGTETFMTVGMRGVHDGRMEGVKTSAEYRDALHEVFDVQRDLLKKYINPNVEEIPQTMVLYKEVLDVYKEGLEVPDYVTLMWTDDNDGHISNLSNKEEQKRKGGSGVYYHVSYWGSPHDYLWLSSTQPALVYSEMKRAWDYNARKLWILNVGDIKPAEYLTELFLDMGWNIESINEKSLKEHSYNWAAREFGGQKTAEIAEVMKEYYRLASIRRPEFMGFNKVEIEGYPRGGLMPVVSPDFTIDEAKKRVADYDAIEKSAIEISKYIPKNLRDAYYQLVEYPVRAASQMNKKFLLTGQPALDAYNEITKLTDHYNMEIANGKWNGIMDMKPRNLPVFESANYTHKDMEVGRPNPKNSLTIYANEFNKSIGIVRTITGLGHSNQASEINRESAVEYEFTIEEEGDYEIQLGFIPMQPANGGDLCLELWLDDKYLGKHSIKAKPFTDRWRANVLRQQAIIDFKQNMKVNSTHFLKIKALDNDIIVDEIKIMRW
ncbi:hypothetical protein KO02_21740 [Sphingobacterium sp. ML3W]|nr:hypothetical protein KO02_21740 [Sphingobacterium sp. ML3W]